MNIDPINVQLKCLFCDSVLTGKEGASFDSGDLIPCAQCGEGNDYDSVLEVAKQKGVSAMKKKLIAELKKGFKL
jgi:hypothetical protein